MIVSNSGKSAPWQLIFPVDHFKIQHNHSLSRFLIIAGNQNWKRQSKGTYTQANICIHKEIKDLIYSLLRVRWWLELPTPFQLGTLSFKCPWQLRNKKSFREKWRKKNPFHKLGDSMNSRCIITIWYKSLSTQVHYIFIFQDGKINTKVSNLTCH